MPLNSLSLTLTTDQFYLNRCLQLAIQGAGHVSPNPMVGATIVKDGQVLGEGYHGQYGQAHAEVNAIHQVKDKAELKASTLYVNLEPCSHHGNTPPCTERIIQAGIPRVVIGCRDDNEKVQGKGIHQLQEAGIQVTYGVLEAEARWINRRFLTYQQNSRPYIILKWAQTSDGFLADPVGNSKWISNPYSRIYVHKWRAEEDSIMIGYQTAVNDNPSLTARSWKGQNPLRIVKDDDLSLSADKNLWDDQAETWLLNQKRDEESGRNRVMKISQNSTWIREILTELYKRGCLSFIVEGGTKTLETFIKSDLWDEARVFTSKTCFRQGLRAPKIGGRCFDLIKILDDELRWIINN